MVAKGGHEWSLRHEFKNEASDKHSALGIVHKYLIKTTGEWLFVSNARERPRPTELTIYI